MPSIKSGVVLPASVVATFHAAILRTWLFI
jgi:hypothetical protein